MKLTAFTFIAKLFSIAATASLLALAFLCATEAHAQTVITLDATTVAPPASSPCTAQPSQAGMTVLTCALTVEPPAQPPAQCPPLPPTPTPTVMLEIITQTAPGSVQYAVGALINGVQYTSIPYPAGQPPFYDGVTQYALSTADGTSTAILDMAMRIWSSGGGRGSGSHVNYYPGAGTITTYP